MSLEQDAFDDPPGWPAQSGRIRKVRVRLVCYLATRARQRMSALATNRVRAAKMAARV